MSSHQWLELENEVCIVTGASGGIGESIVRELWAAGASIVMLDKNAEALQRLVAAIDPGATRTLAIPCDVTDQAALREANANVATRFGAAGVLVNNAGIIRPGSLEDIAVEDWRMQLEVNLNGYFNCAQVFGKGMLSQGHGAIVHISSIAAENPQVRGGAYAPAKAAISMLSRQIAIEWGPRGIRSNCVAPGLIRTPMTEASYQDPELSQKRRDVVPLRRFGEPGDIARAVAFLVSPKSSYVNGQDLMVDGGVTQTLMSHIPRADHG